MKKNTVLKNLSKEELEVINASGIPWYVKVKPTFKGLSSVYEAYKFAGGEPLVGTAQSGGSACIMR